MGEVIKFQKFSKKGFEESPVSLMSNGLWGSVASVLARLNEIKESPYVSVQKANLLLADGYLWNIRRSIAECLKLLLDFEGEVPSFYKDYYEGMKVYFLDLAVMIDKFDSTELTEKDFSYLVTINSAFEEWQEWRENAEVQYPHAIVRDLFRRLNP